MSWKDFVSWREYDRMQPIGGERLDYLVASIVSTMVNTKRNTDRYPDPFPLSDFLLKWGDEAPKNFKKPEVKPSWQRLKMIGQLCAATFNIIEEENEAKREKARRRKKG